MFDVGDLPLLTFGNCALKTTVIKWHLKLYVGFLRFFQNQKKHDYVLSELVHTFHRTLATPLSRRKKAPPNARGHTSWLVPPGAGNTRRLYILCWSEFSRRRLLPALSPAAGHPTTPTAAGLPGLCENFRPTTSKSSPILRLLSSHWATSVVKTRVVGVANVGDSLRRLSSLQHRIYNLLVFPAPGGTSHEV